MRGERVVETAQRPRRGGQVHGHADAISRVREDPAVVVVAQDAVRHRGRVAEQGVLAQVVGDRAFGEAPQRQVGVHLVQHAVLNLLPDIVLAVGLVDLYQVPRLVDGRHVNLRMEVLQRHRQDVTLGTRRGADVVVAGVVPAAHVHAVHRLQRLVRRPVVLRLHVAVDVVARRRHQGVVQVAGVVPDLIFLHHLHVAHLHGQEVLDHRLPHAPVVDVRSDPEDGRRAVAVADTVEPLLPHVGEVGLQVLVAKEVPFPKHGGDALHEMLAVGVVAQQRRARERGVAAVGLDDRDLALVRQIAHLRGLHHRRIGPAGNDRGLDIPFHRPLRRPGGDVGAEHKPAVVVVHAAVIELQGRRAQRANGQAAGRVVRAGGEGLPDGVGLGNHGVRRERAVALADEVLDVGRRRVRGLEIAHTLVDIALLRQHRSVRLLRVDALPVVHDPGFPEEVAGEELEVETGAADEGVGDGRLQVHRHQESLAGRLQRHGILELHVRVNHRVEACLMAAGIREAQGGPDAPALDLAVELSGDRLPLAGRGLEADVAVAGDAVAVHQDRDAALVPFGIEITEGHHVHAVPVEIAGVIEAEILGPGQGADRHQHSHRSHTVQKANELSHTNGIMGFMQM